VLGAAASQLNFAFDLDWNVEGQFHETNGTAGMCTDFRSEDIQDQIGDPVCSVPALLVRVRVR